MSDSIETARLRLRRLRPDDHDAWYAGVFADDAVMKTLPYRAAIDRTTFDVQGPRLMVSSWADHGFGPWIVAQKTSDEVLGHCGLRLLPDTEDVEVLYALKRAAWGEGIATEAARASVEYGFRTLGLDRIIGMVLPENTASRRVLEKLGMCETGPRRFGDLDVVGYALAHEPD